MRAIAIRGALNRHRWQRAFRPAVLWAALTSTGCSVEETTEDAPTGASVSAGTTSSSGTSSSAGSASGGGGAGGGGDATVKVQILAINDFHGNLEPPAGGGGKITLPDTTKVDAGGAAYLATHIAALRAQNPNTIVVSAGDLIGASPLTSALFRDEPTIEAMNMIGLNINGIGNHEFDKGSSELLRMQYGGCSATGCNNGMFFPGATFQFLSANVLVDAATSKTLFPRYDIRTFDGVKVAFVGMTLEGTPTIVTPTGVAGLTFADEAQTVNALIPELQAQGAKAIVVLIHEGGFPMGTYDECPSISGPIVDIAMNMSDAVDVIVSGHTHQAYNCKIGGKIVTSAASFGRLITDIDLDISKATGQVVSKVAKNVIVSRDVALDTSVDALVTDFKNLAAPLADKPIGSITADLDRVVPAGGAGVTTMGEVIADAQLDATKAAAAGGAEVAFMNPGGVRADLVYLASKREPSNGIVTYGEAFTVQPFGNSLVVLTLTGAQIKTMLEQQWQPDASNNVKVVILQPSANFSYAYSATAPVGSKIDLASIKLNGKPLDAAQNYRVTVNSFLAPGGDGFKVLASGVDPVGGKVDIDALVDYFAGHSPIAPPSLDRITILP